MDLRAIADQRAVADRDATRGSDQNIEREIDIIADDEIAPWGDPYTRIETGTFADMGADSTKEERFDTVQETISWQSEKDPHGHFIADHQVPVNETATHDEYLLVLLRCATNNVQ